MTHLNQPGFKLINEFMPYILNGATSPLVGVRFTGGQGVGRPEKEQKNPNLTPFMHRAQIYIHYINTYTISPVLNFHREK